MKDIEAWKRRIAKLKKQSDSRKEFAEKTTRDAQARTLRGIETRNRNLDSTMASKEEVK